MKPLSIMLRTGVFRGDHESDVAIAFEARPDETVSELVERTNLHRTEDWIEIRMVVCDAADAAKE